MGEGKDQIRQKLGEKVKYIIDREKKNQHTDERNP